MINTYIAAVIALLTSLIYVSGNIEAYQGPVTMLVGITAFCWALFYFHILDVLSDKRKHFKHIKKVVILIIALVSIINLISIVNTGDLINPFFIKAVLDADFMHHAGISYYTVVASVLALVIFFLFALYLLRNYSIASDARLSRRALAILLALLLFDQLTFAYLSFSGSRMPDRMFASMPWRPFLTSSSFFNRFKVNIDPDDFRLNPDGLDSVSVSLAGDLPNIIFVVADSLRGGMLNSELMPFLFSRDGDIYDNHFSASTCTHMGLFSAVSGLFTTYFKSAVTDGYTPFIFKLAKDNGYEMNLISSSKMDWMGTRKFVEKDLFNDYVITSGLVKKDADLSFLEYINAEKISESLNDYAPSLRKEILNELYIIKNFKEQIKRKKAGLPGFYFLFFNATHATYRYPEGLYSFFRPEADYDGPFTSINYFLDREKYFNRYKNATRFLDDMVKEIILSLRDQGMFDNSIIVFTGDHGEEFYENGGIFHSGEPNWQQLSTPLYIKMPHAEGKRIVDTTTTHLDIVPTIAEYFYIDLPGMFKGTNIQKLPLKERNIFSSHCEKEFPYRFVKIGKNEINEISLLQENFNHDMETLKRFLEFLE